VVSIVEAIVADLAKQSKVVGTDSDKIKQIASIFANDEVIVINSYRFRKSRKEGCHHS
jgi:chaperonin GroEL